MKKIFLNLLVSIIILSCFSFMISGEETRIDIDSQTERSSDFISINRNFTGADGNNYQLIMYGLKEGNAEKFVEALQNHYISNTENTLTIADNAIADCEKFDTFDMSYESDSEKCWAAAASEVLWMSGWASHFKDPLTDSNFSSEDDLFTYFDLSYSNGGGNTNSGINWFFMGEYFMTSYSPGNAHRLEETQKDGLLKQLCSAAINKKTDISYNYRNIKELLKCDWSQNDPKAFQASIGSLSSGEIGSSGHSLTCVGVIIDPAAQDISERYKAILFIDSDNDALNSGEYDELPKDEKIAQRITKPNTINIYNLKLINDINGDPCWNILGYGSEGDEETILYSVNGLSIYDEALIEKHRETQGNCRAFDTVDLIISTLFCSDNTERYEDMYRKNADKLAMHEYKQGDPISLNYFVADSSRIDFDETQYGENSLELEWKLYHDDTLIKQGKDTCTVPIISNAERGNLIILNTNEILPAGEYKVSLNLNPDRSITEAYYLNNNAEYHFTILEDEKPDYEYKIDKGENGSWQKGNSNTLDFHIISDSDHDPYDNFLKVMDGDSELDPSVYETVQGSLILKLKPSYLNNLAIGRHELNIIFKDNKNLFIHFNISEAEKKEEKKEEKTDYYKIPITGIK